MSHFEVDENLLTDNKVICHEENNELYKIKWSCIEAVNDVQEVLDFSLANYLRKKHIMWTKHKMMVSLAAQTFSSSVAKAVDFMCDEIDKPVFVESEATTNIIKKVDMAFDMINSRNPFATGTKAPVRDENLQNLMTKCDELAAYIFALKDDRGRYLRNG